MQILEVLIEYGLSSLNRTFSYSYLGDQEIESGVRVLVNFNHKEIIGYVMKVTKTDMSLEDYQKDSIFLIKESYHFIFSQLN